MGSLPTVCPACGYRADSVAAVGGDAPRYPEDGSVSVCIRCGEPALFAVGPLGLTLRPPSDAERAEILSEPIVARTLAAWQAWASGRCRS